MCPSTPQAHLTVEPRLSAARVARDFVRGCCCPQHAGDVLDVALLLVSELVTNAVRHGRPPVSVDVDCDEDDVLAVLVSDAGTSPLRVLDLTADADAEGGRGLAIVEALATEWGVTPRESGGKGVWFRLDPTKGHGFGGASPATPSVGHA